MDKFLHNPNVGDLDKLIQSFEFENQNCVKLIEKENQHHEALHKELTECKSLIVSLQDKSFILDEETKRAHKQYTFNRDNCESLKKTMTVLKEHDEALDKKLESLEHTYQQERNEREEIVKHYTEIWDNYQEKYKKFPLAQTLEEKQKDVSCLEKDLEVTESRIQQLKSKINEINESKEDEIKDLNKFIIKLAEVKLSTETISSQIRQAVIERQETQARIEKERKVMQEKAELSTGKNTEVGKENKTVECMDNKTSPSSEEEIQLTMDVEQVSQEECNSMLISTFSDKQEEMESRSSSSVTPKQKPTLQPTICHPLIQQQPELKQTKPSSHNVPHQTNSKASILSVPQLQKQQQQPVTSNRPIPQLQHQTQFVISSRIQPQVQKQQPVATNRLVPQVQHQAQLMASQPVPQLQQQQRQPVTMPQLQPYQKQQSCLPSQQIQQQLRTSHSSDQQQIPVQQSSQHQQPLQQTQLRMSLNLQASKVPDKPPQISLPYQRHQGKGQPDNGTPIRPQACSRSPVVSLVPSSTQPDQPRSSGLSSPMVFRMPQSPQISSSSQERAGSVSESNHTGASVAISKLCIPQHTRPMVLMSPRVSLASQAVVEPTPSESNLQPLLVQQKTPSNNSPVTSASGSPSITPQLLSKSPTTSTGLTLPSNNKTPPPVNRNQDAEDMELSPFDIEKHRKQVKLMSKSPGPISFSARTMFSVDKSTSDSKDEEGFLNPFLEESNAPFSRNSSRSGDQVMNLFGGENTHSIFGSGKGDSPDVGNKNFSGGHNLLSLFGDKTNQAEEEETSFSFNFNEGNRESSPGGNVLMSLFGNTTDKDQTDNVQESSFTFNFGGENSGSSAENNLMSLFGDGGDKRRNAQESSFSFNFGSNQSDSPRTFNLF